MNEKIPSLIWKLFRAIFIILKGYKGILCLHKNRVYKRRTKKQMKNLSQMIRFWCMHKILVHAQDSCACTTLLCMHNTLVHALEGPGTKAGTQKTNSCPGPDPRLFFCWVPAGRTRGCSFVVIPPLCHSEPTTCDLHHLRAWCGLVHLAWVGKHKPVPSNAMGNRQCNRQ